MSRWSKYQQSRNRLKLRDARFKAQALWFIRALSAHEGTHPPSSGCFQGQYYADRKVH